MKLIGRKDDPVDFDHLAVRSRRSAAVIVKVCAAKKPVAKMAT
jgi:hypothetical protein